MIDTKTLKNDYPGLYANHIELYDYFTIEPFLGRRRKMELKRTGYTLRGKAVQTVEVERGHQIALPCPAGKEFKLELEKSSNNLFLLRSLDRPFKINGVHSFSSYIQDGDEVIIHYNKLKFHKEVEQKSLLPEYFGPKLVQSSLNVLLEGETGTGKSHLAKKIHEESQRVGPFIQLNLASFSSTLLESELFGHKKGAFTGAINDKRGALEEANHGTLFLDEIDSLPKDIQTKLLLFLDNKSFRQVGGSGEKNVDVRLIFASGKKLKMLSEAGEFRADLYFRISSGISYQLKPLREDKKFLEFLLDDFCRREDVSLSFELRSFYLSCFWPGNIRQLLGHLELKKVMATGRVLEYGEVDRNLFTKGKIEKSLSEHMSLEEMKKAYAQEVFLLKGQNKSHACQALGVTKNTLNRLLVA